MGMSPNVHETSVPAMLLHAGLTVMDIVYNPRDTQLLKDAKAAGCRTIPGLECFFIELRRSSSSGPIRLLQSM